MSGMYRCMRMRFISDSTLEKLLSIHELRLMKSYSRE